MSQEMSATLKNIIVAEMVLTDEQLVKLILFYEQYSHEMQEPQGIASFKHALHCLLDGSTYYRFDSILFHILCEKSDAAEDHSIYAYNASDVKKILEEVKQEEKTGISLKAKMAFIGEV